MSRLKAAVSVEQRRIRAVFIDALLVGEEHRDRRFVLRLVSNLFDLVGGEVTFLSESESLACVQNIEAQVQRPWDLWVEQARAKRNTQTR